MKDIKTNIKALPEPQKIELFNWLSRLVRPHDPLRNIGIKTYLPYSHHTYTRPWAAIVKSWKGDYPTLNFSAGTYIGNHSGGYLTVLCHRGDIIKFGQNTHNGKSAHHAYIIINDDWSLDHVSASEARSYYHTLNPNYSQPITPIAELVK